VLVGLFRLRVYMDTVYVIASTMVLLVKHFNKSLRSVTIRFKLFWYLNQFTGHWPIAW